MKAVPLLLCLLTIPAHAETGCRDGVGLRRAQHIVNDCIMVSPATHPSCNLRNSCAMMAEEIRRGCGLIGADRPKLCQSYERGAPR